MRRMLLYICMLPLAACGAQTSVQGGYNGDRDDCQSLSEDLLPRFLDASKEVSVKERNAKLVTLFSDCMYERGWTVATPTRAKLDEFTADPGVGVGASVRPGRFSTEDQPAGLDPSPAAPQNQGAIVETPDLITDQGGPGIARKVPSQNPTISPPQ